MKCDVDFNEIEDLLREWAHFFRDRRALVPHNGKLVAPTFRCGSGEHNFRPHSDDFAAEGWGEMAKPPSDRRRTFLLSRAIKTNEAIVKLPKTQRWALTYQFCYPHLPKGMTLRMMKKWVGRPVSWKVYVEQIEVGRFRLYAWLKTS